MEGLVGVPGRFRPAFQPSEVHRVLRKIIDSAGKRPRGKDLLKCRKRFNFTVKVDKTPYRKEEALERLVIASNIGGRRYEIFDQIPIGGGKESIDLGLRKGPKFTFIELKAWDSKDNPLYGLIEILKNLIEYRVIQDMKIKEPLGEEIELCLLAPKSYYISYGLIDPQGGISAQKRKLMGDLLQEMAAEFQTKIFLMSLDLDEKEFQKKCFEISTREGVVAQRSICCNEQDCLSALKAENWKVVAASQ